VYFAPSPGARRLLRRMRRYIAPGQPFDDQMAINHALRDVARLKWGETAPLPPPPPTKSTTKATQSSTKRRRLLSRQQQHHHRKQQARPRQQGSLPLHPIHGRREISVGRGSLPPDSNDEDDDRHSRTLSSSSSSSNSKSHRNDTAVTASVGGVGVGAGAGAGGVHPATAVSLTVGLLPHSVAPRRCDFLSPSELAAAAALHCYCAKSGKAKRAAGRRYKTWFLPEPTTIATTNGNAEDEDDDDPYADTAAAIFRNNKRGVRVRGRG
jgi:hypothetical protein